MKISELISALSKLDGDDEVDVQYFIESGVSACIMLNGNMVYYKEIEYDSAIEKSFADYAAERENYKSTHGRYMSPEEEAQI